MHTLTVRVVFHIGDAFNTLFLYQISDTLDQTCLVHLIGYLGHYDFEAAVFLFLNFCTGAHGNAAAAGTISSPDSAAAHNDAAGGEVRPFDMLHHFIQCSIRVINQAAHTVNGFAHVMGRNVGSHTYGNTGRAIHQQIWEMAGEHLGLLQTVIIVGAKIYGILVDISQHIDRQLAHTRFCITISSRRVAVHRTKVTVAVYQHIPHGEILCQAHQCIIN